MVLAPFKLRCCDIKAEGADITLRLEKINPGVRGSIADQVLFTHPRQATNREYPTTSNLN